MTTFALDTNIISYILRENAAVVSRVRQTLAAKDRLIIPPLAYYEVRRGLLSAHTPVQTAAFDKFCQTMPIGKIEHETLEEAARIYASLKKQGRPTGDADILIAAFCIVNGHTLVTNNTKHFEGIDALSIVDWSDDDDT